LNKLDTSAFENWGLHEFKGGFFLLNGWQNDSNGVLARWVSDGED